MSESTDDLAYRLRCETKRTDLPVEVIRNYADAYAAICELQRRIDNIKQGFEGCCTACEPVGELNKKLREERDEARREIMNSVIDQACSNEEIEEEYRKRGWSYLKKENTNV